MPKDRSFPSLQFQVGASRTLMAALLMIHLGAFLVIFMVNVTVDISVVLWTLIAVSLLHALLTLPGMTFRHSRLVCRWLANDEWEFVTRAGEKQFAQLCSAHVACPWVIILFFRSNNSTAPIRSSLLLCADAISAEDFHQLKVRVKTHRYSLGEESDR